MKLKTKILTMALPLLAAMPAWAQETPPAIDKGDTAWMLVSSLLVLMMTLPGLALFYGGLVRKDNILATLMQTVGVAFVTCLIWPIIGYTMAFSEGAGFVGDMSKLFLKGVTTTSVSGTIPETVFIMFQMTFAVITTAIIVGAVANRIRFSAVMIFSALWMVLVYAPVAHWVWGPGGFIGGVGMPDYTGIMGFGKGLDFAGGTVVHITSGISGLVAALVLGKSLKAEESSSNNVILSVLGASLLWVGWFGFNAGSAVAANQTAGMAMLVTNTAAAAAGLTWVIGEWIIKGKPSVVGAISGIVAGLVAITPAAGFVGFGASIAFGIIAAVVCMLAVAYIKEKLGYDDSLDAFGIHGVGGITGAVLTGVFSSASIGGVSGMLEGNGSQVVAQILAVAVCAAYAAIVTFVILKVMKLFMTLRVDEAVERAGLDVALHGDEVKVYKS